MCASFHPKEDLIVSASLDQTVRVWYIGALRKKPVSPADDILRLSEMNIDKFGGDVAVVKYVLEGHDRGVNWASFHPNLPLIVSGADDLQVKLWKMNDTKAWEVDTFRGHMDNVSCVMFHAKQDIIVSISVDKSICIWDATKRTAIQTFRLEHDRFWILSAHPEMNLLAAGHDSGMIVFKLERERPAFTVSGDCLYYVKNCFLRVYEFSHQKDNQVIPIRRPGNVSLKQGPRTLSFSPTKNAVLICSDADGGTYELYIVPKDNVGRADVVQDAKKGGGSAVFVARNRFAVLDKSTNQVLIKSLKNEIVEKIPLPIATDTIFYAGTGNLLCRAEDKIVIFDLQQRLVLGVLQLPAVRYIVWSSDMETIALLSKHIIIIADKKLVHRCTLYENIRVKSGVWDENGVFIYTTLNHIKYCLPNGDNDIIRTLDIPIYLTKVSDNNVYCLDRDGKNRVITIDATGYILKLALLGKKYDDFMSMIKNSRLCGQPVIAYLQSISSNEENGGWDIEDLELPPVAVALVTPGRSVRQFRLQSSSFAGELAAAGDFDTAMRLLNWQLGIINFTPLKQIFMDSHTGSRTYLPNVRNLPSLVSKFSQLDEKLMAAYRATTEGKFPEALRLFLNILYIIPIIVVDSKREVYEVKALIELVKEYVLGLKIEMRRKETKDDVIRQQELAAYFTNCNLQKVHTRLVFNSAMTICFKGGNYATAEYFARMLLESSPTDAQAKKARQVLQACVDKADAQKLNYDFKIPFVVCGATFVPINCLQKHVSCPYCGASFVPSIKGKLCTVCELA